MHRKRSKKSKKLHLDRETVRTLKAELGRAAGGTFITADCPPTLIGCGWTALCPPTFTCETFIECPVGTFDSCIDCPTNRIC